jgi:hypothetical protein
MPGDVFRKLDRDLHYCQDSTARPSLT